MNSVLLSILTLFGLFYQVLTLNEVSLFNYIPNILIALLIFSHFYLNINYHTLLFFLVGLALDCSNPLMFGTITFSFMLISYLTTTIRKHIDLHIFVNKLVLVVVSNAVFYLIYLFFSTITYKQPFPIILLNFAISLFLNTIFSVIIITVLDFIRMLKLDYSNE